jgi:hypothetical protein
VKLEGDGQAASKRQVFESRMLYIQQFSTYFTVNTLRIHYKDQPVKVLAEHFLYTVYIELGLLASVTECS